MFLERHCWCSHQAYVWSPIERQFRMQATRWIKTKYGLWEPNQLIPYHCGVPHLHLIPCAKWREPCLLASSRVVIVTNLHLLSKPKHCGYQLSSPVGDSFDIIECSIVINNSCTETVLSNAWLLVLTLHEW